jgi:tRNA 2-selenouridine synthase SelU
LSNSRAEAVAILSQALTKTTDYQALPPLAQGLSAVATRMEAREAVATLNQAMTKTTNPLALQSLAQCLSAVATRMEAGEAVATLSQAMTKTTDYQALQSLAQGLSAVTARMEAKEAKEAAATLSQAMTKTTDPRALLPLAQGLSAVATRMEAGEAVATLNQAMTMTTNPLALQSLAQGLSAAANRLGPKEAAATLSLAITKTTDPQALPPLAQGLSAVAGRLGPKEAGEAAATLSQAMAKTTDSLALQSLAQGLSAVTARMEAKEAAAVCGQGTAILSQAMAKTTHPQALQSLAQGLSAVTARMEAKEAAAVCGQGTAILSQTMTTVWNPEAWQSLSQGLSAVASRLGPKEAKEAAAILSQDMTKATGRNSGGSQSLAQGLSAVATRMEAGEAVTTLSQAMTKTTHPPEMQSLAQGLSAVTGRLGPKEAGEAAATLSLAMTKTTNPLALQSLAQGLSAVAARMEAKEAAATLSLAITKTTDFVALSPLAQGLSAVTGRLGPKEAGEAAATLSQAMTKMTYPLAFQSLAQGLSAVLHSDYSWRNASQRYRLIGAIGTLAGPASLLLAPALFQPPPPPLPAQTLVDLLKQPFCVGEARQLVLGQLARHYLRPFADQWDFVRFAQEHKLPLDLLTPPQRPGSASLDQTVRVWEASPVPDEVRQRRWLVSRVRLLFKELGLQQEVLAALRKDPTLDETDRELALQVAQALEEDPALLNEVAWKVVKARDAGKDDYALALRQAEAAVRLAPRDENFLTTLGISQFRAGRYAEALSTLAKSEKLSAAKRGRQARNLAFLAMAQYQLGKTDEAKATLGRLREVRKQPRWPIDVAEAAYFLREAEGLIGGYWSSGTLEGEKLKVLGRSSDYYLGPQGMIGFLDSRWSSDVQLYAKPPKVGSWADLELPVPAAGKYIVIAYLTKARDYGIVQFHLDGKQLGKPIDCFEPEKVLRTGPLNLGTVELKKGPNTLRVEVIGTNPRSVGLRTMWGLDCIILKPVKP